MQMSASFTEFVFTPPWKASITVKAVYYGRTFECTTATVSQFNAHLKNLLGDCDGTASFDIIGFDVVNHSQFTSSEAQLLQLSNARFSMLIHRHSGLMSSKLLLDFFRNASARLLFVGVNSLPGTLNFPMSGCLDLAHNKSGNALQIMMRDIFNVSWYVEDGLRKSDWSNGDSLTTEQLTHGALSAWACHTLGVATVEIALLPYPPRSSFSPPTQHTQHIVFSTALIPDDLRLKLRDIYLQSFGLQSLETEKLKPVNIQNMRTNPKNPMRFIDIVSAQYGNHIRKDCSLLVKICSPKGSPDGITIDATCRAAEGRRSTIDIGIIPQPSSTTNEIDQRMLSSLSNGPAIKITKYWKILDDKYGNLVNSHLTQQEKEYRRQGYVRVSLIVKDEGNALLTNCQSLISDFVFSHTVSPLQSVLQYKSAALASEFSDALNIFMSRNLFRSSPYSCPSSPAEDDEIDSYATNLNDSQAIALGNAFRNKFSVITGISVHKIYTLLIYVHSTDIRALYYFVLSGPPGTGKTRTIAAIADVATTTKRRVLILAPTNAASRRILESIHGTGFDDVCLIVSTEYFYEWHEGSYAGSLRDLVHTKSSVSLAHEHDDRGKFNYSRESGRQTRDRNDDFNGKGSVSHIGKWTKTSESMTGRRPSVVIGTHGCLSLALSRGASKKKGKLISWVTSVKNLIAIDSIDMVVIDETSQVWEGYFLELMKLCKKAKRFVFVGDDKQLPPFGEDSLENLSSLFSASLKCSFIPNVMLNTSFRLTPAVASLLSSKLYGGGLIAHRNLGTDHDFVSFLTKAKANMSAGGIGKFLFLRAIDFAQLESSFGNLAWIHHEYPSYVAKNLSTGNNEEAALVAKCFADIFFVVNGSKLKIAVLTPYLEVS